MRVVLDTNVLVSGLISPNGPPGSVLGLLESAPIVPCFSAIVFGEYREVLARPEFGFPHPVVERLLERIVAAGELIPEEPLGARLPDPKDEPFLATAVSAFADFLVTGNLRHFPPHLRAGVRVVSPREFLEALRRP